MSPSVTHSQWRIVGTQRLLFKAWDDDTAIVCYDNMSGDTHLLSPFAAELLAHLQSAATLRLDALASHMAASSGLENDQSLVTSIETILTEFSERGVVAPA